jgi:hypothetical protein
VLHKRLVGREKPVEDIISPAAVDILARASGGVMRELIRLFRGAARIARQRNIPQIDETIALDAVGRQRQEIAPRLNIQHRQALQEVLKQGTLSGIAAESAFTFLSG